MRTVTRALLVLSIAIQGSFALADGLTVKRSPKEGTIVKYSMTVDFDVNGGQGHLQATLSEKVMSVDKDGNYAIEQSQSDASGTYNAEKIDVPPRPAILLTYKPSGQVSNIKDVLNVGTKTDLVDSMSYRMENLGTILDPGKELAIGDLWVATLKADKALGTVDVKAEYKLLLEEKIGDIDTIKVKANLKEGDGEKPAQNEFIEWINKADGSLVQLEAKWTNAPFPGVTYPVNATIKITRLPQ